MFKINRIYESYKKVMLSNVFTPSFGIKSFKLILNTYLFYKITLYTPCAFAGNTVNTLLLVDSFPERRNFYIKQKALKISISHLGWLFLCIVYPLIGKISTNVNPKSVIRPFYVLFYNCLQSFGFYKLSFACF